NFATREYKRDLCEDCKKANTSSFLPERLAARKYPGTWPPCWVLELACHPCRNRNSNFALRKPCPSEIFRWSGPGRKKLRSGWPKASLSAVCPATQYLRE